MLAAHHRPIWYLAPDHEANEPDDDAVDWEIAAGDLLRFFDQQGLEQVIGVGHSLGAVATMLAARQQPERFSAIVLIDPVFLSPEVLALTADATPEQLQARPMVQGALRRRDRWASRQEAFDRFRAKPVFERFSDEALWDYLNHGLHEEPETGEVVLSYPRNWEARFYTDPPQMVWDELPQLTVPTLAIRATRVRHPLPRRLGAVAAAPARPRRLWRWMAWGIWSRLKRRWIRPLWWGIGWGINTVWRKGNLKECQTIWNRLLLPFLNTACVSIAR